MLQLSKSASTTLKMSTDAQNAYLKYVQRRLQTLDGPDKLKVNNDTDYRRLVSWLEDRIIRQLKVEDREDLKKTMGPIGKWKPHFQKYLKNLDASDFVINSIKTNDWRPICMQFLLDYAVELKQDDDTDKMDTTGDTTGTSSDSIKFENIDPTSPDFKKGVDMLSSFLQISVPKTHFTPAQTFEACINLLESRFDNRIVPDKGFRIESLEKINPGFETGDKILNNIGRILRLLHLQNFRTFQNMINECIVAVQELTANPKTDQRLGQVGRG